MSEKQKRVQIIILTKDGREITRILLDSIQRNTIYSNFKIIVIDNGSTDGTTEMIKENFPQVRLIRNSQNLGIPRARNQGLKQTKADYYLILDNDIEIITPGWLQDLVKTIERSPNIGIVGPKQIDHAGNIVSMQDDVDEPKEVKSIIGAAMLFRATVFDKIGYLDEGYSPIFFEDLDICYRARKAGWKVIYDPRITLIHAAHSTLGTVELIYRDYYLFIKGKLRFMLINLPIRQIIRDLIAGLWIVKDYVSTSSSFSLPQVTNSFNKARSYRPRKIHCLLRAMYRVLCDLPEILLRRRYAGMKMAK